MKKLLLFTFAIAFFPLQLFAQWHQLPGPSGGSVNDFCEIAGSNGGQIYAATTDGVYLTTDHGNYWHRIGLAHQNVTKIIQYVITGEEVLFSIVDSQLVCRSFDSAANWETVFTFGPLVNIYQDGNDIVVGLRAQNTDTSRGIFRSTDIGASWSHQAFPPPEGYFNNFVVADGRIFGVTVDSGVWTMSSTSKVWGRTTYPYWHSAQMALVVGQDLFVAGVGRIDVSTDFGVSWLHIPNQGLDTTSTVSAITSFAVNGLTIVVTGEAVTANGVLRTMNGASTWERLDGTGGFPRIWSARSIAFFDNAFWVATDAGVLQSTDAITWVYRTDSLPSRVLDVASFDSTLFAITGRGIFRSADRGNTWAIPTGKNDLVDSLPMSFVMDGENLYALGWPGFVSSLWKWNGTQWITLTNLPVTSVVRFRGALFAAAQSAGVMISTDQGITWNPINSRLPLGLNVATALIATDTRLLVTLTPVSQTYSDVYSLDSTENWNWLSKIGNFLLPTSSAYADGIAYLAGVDSSFAFSTDDGASWNVSHPDISAVRAYDRQAVVTITDSLEARHGAVADLLLLDSLTGRLNNFGYDSQNGYIATDSRGIWAASLTNLALAVTPSPRAPLPLRLSIFPNPSTGHATIDFTLPERGNISLKLFDERGVKVATYFAGMAGPGEVQVPIDASELSAGSYIAVLSTRESTGVARVAILPR